MAVMVWQCVKDVGDNPWTEDELKGVPWHPDSHEEVMRWIEDVLKTPENYEGLGKWRRRK